MGATSGTTVGATVLSATTLSITPAGAPPNGCESHTASVTSFGDVAPGTGNVTASDCNVVWGSSNDSAMLRVHQADGTGTAMQRWGWSGQSSGYGSVLYDLAAADDQRAWAVGWNGTIRATTDGGATWTGQTSPQTSNAWRGIAATSATDLHLVGASGTAAVSTDGATWTSQSSGVGTHLYDVDFRTAQVGIAVGASGVARLTSNGGTTWSASGATGTTSAIWGVTHVSGTTWVLVGSGLIRRSTDDGASWTTITQPVGGTTLRAVDAAHGIVLAVGSGGSVFRSTDGGATFTALASGTTADLHGVKVLSATEFIAAGTGGTIRRSRDGGATWRDDGSGSTTWMHAINGASRKLWVVGEGGLVRTYAGTAALPDFDPTTANWSTTGGMFAACLETAANGAVAGSAVSGWTAAGDGGCTTAYTGWRPIVATGGTAGSKIAEVSGADTDASVTLRFGFKAATNQAPGVYEAPVVFEVVAPTG